MDDTRPRLAMTVDVEEWFTGVADDSKDLNRFESRLAIGMDRILEVLRETGTRATFFFLGYIAERWPHWVNEVARRGHEVGSHGLYHRALWDSSPDEFRADVSRSRRALFAAGATRVDGFRAPRFSLRQDTLWAPPILEELGFRYSSSVFPIYNPRYGYPKAPPLPFHSTQSGFIEFPISTLRVGRARIPFAGGFYLRALPALVLRAAFARLVERGEQGVCYVHPWEFDPEQPRLPVSPLTQARHRLGLRSAASKVDMLLRTFRFGTMSEVLAPVAGGSPARPS